MYFYLFISDNIWDNSLRDVKTLNKIIFNNWYLIHDDDGKNKRR